MSLASQFDDGVQVLAMGVGFLETYQSMVQVRKQVGVSFMPRPLWIVTFWYFNLIGQVIVVLGSDWTIVCLNAKLKHLWTRKITEKTYKITGSVNKGLKCIITKGVWSSGKPRCLCFQPKMTKTRELFSLAGESISKVLPLKTASQGN